MCGILKGFSGLNRVVALCQRNASLISAFAATSSLVVSVLTFFLGYEIVRVSRIERVVGLEQRFSSDELSKIKNRISDAWAGGNDEYHEEAFFVGDPVWTMHQYEVLKSEKLKSKDINAVLEFYNVVFVCVGKGLCDKETAVSFFTNFADQFLVHHMPYICEHRDFFNLGSAKGIIGFANWSYDNPTTYSEYLQINCDRVKSGLEMPLDSLTVAPLQSASCKAWYAGSDIDQ